MVDMVVSKSELIDAQKDAQALDDVVNGPAEVQVQTRLGRYVWTLATLEQRSLLKISQWQDAISMVTSGSGTPALAISDASGKNQQQINDELRYDSGIYTWSGRTQRDHNKEFVSDKDYGAIGDGLYHPLSEKYSTLALAKFAYQNIQDKITSLTQSIDWAAAQSAITANSCVYLSDDSRVITNTIDVLDGHGFIGSYKLKQTPQNTPESNKGVLLFYGTGTRDNIAPTLGDEVYQVANPNIGDAYLADSGTRGNTYKLRNFNELFSAAVKLGSGSYLERITVLPYHSDGTTDGTAGYRGSSTTCADEWDVGIWCANVVNWSIRDVWAKGQWRKAGLLISASQINDGKTTVANDCWIVQNSSFGGGVGLSIRADNANPVGFTNYGFGNGSFINCQFYGFQHQSSHLATSSILAKPLDRPSGCFEISGNGNVPRGIDFVTCTFLTREDINIFAGKSSEIKFIGCYQESKTAKVNNVWDVAALGSRMVVSSDANLQFIGHSKYGIDFSPNMTRETSIARYGSVSGVCNSNAILSDDDYEEFKYIGSTGPRLRRSTGVWGVADYLNSLVFSVDNLGNVSSNGSLKSATEVLSAGAFISDTQGGALTLRRRNSAGSIETVFYISGTDSKAVEIYGNIYGNTDNVLTSGTAARRFSTTHLGSAPIVTSDETLKQQFRSQSEAEKLAAIEIKNSICLFKFNDAVDLKGDGARWHVGVKAQQVVSILESHGLNPFNYGFVCLDEWEIGSRYAIRYEELTMFILSAI